MVATTYGAALGSGFLQATCRKPTTWVNGTDSESASPEVKARCCRPGARSHLITLTGVLESCGPGRFGSRSPRRSIYCAGLPSTPRDGRL